MAERPHRRLAKCHVLFLGDSTPEESSHGLKALQQPLMKCYPVDNPNSVEGIDSWLTTFTSGMLLQYVGGKSEQTQPIWFPIQNLYLAAATKCINYIDKSTGQRIETEFVDINNQAAKHSSHPPLFSIIVRKASGKRILRCYTFLVRDEAPAVAMVDAAKYAFTHESGWSTSPPSQEVIRSELVAPAEDTADEIDQYDSVSAAGRRAHNRRANPNTSPGNHSQNVSDSDVPSASESRASQSFPAHLVKNYTLTNTSKRVPSPTRRPIPAAFMYGSPVAVNSSVRSSHHGGIRVGPPIPQYMLNGADSLRSTSSVRVINDPRMRASVIERVIREPVPVPVPVYQPPPPPQIIREPVYIRQPPEIRHVHVDREVPVPVEVPVPYPVAPNYPVAAGDFDDHRSGKHSRRHKPHKHHTFKNYQIFDERFARREPERPSFFVNSNQLPYSFSSPANGFFNPPGEHYHVNPPHKMSPRRRDRSSSSSSSSDDEGQRFQQYNPYRNRGGGIEIIELSSPDDRRPAVNERPDINGNHNESNYHIKELEKGIGNFQLRNANIQSPEFKWSAKPSKKSSREDRKAERQSKRESRKPKDDEIPADYDRGKVYVGAEPVDLSGRDKNRSSFYAFEINGHDDGHGQERKSKKKDKRRRDKTPSKHGDQPDYAGSSSKEYYFKEHTENPPRNWMDQQKGYMNERAFSSSLANDPDDRITNAYALNRETDDDDMFDRSMPPAPPPGGIPIPPPLPKHLQAAGADLY